MRSTKSREDPLGGNEAFMDVTKSDMATGRPPSRRPEPATDPTTVPAIELVGIAKRFHSRRGTVTAVERVDLVIGEGEFFSLLGPSGCGKTTTLRMIGGFEEPTEGQILLYGKDVVGVPPNHRDVNMVFQSYALFPHMSVFDNVAFGLRRKSVGRHETDASASNEMLELVQLEGKSDRRPRELSGGQQQRVALARALVNQPRALLLDEPLAALDLKLRQAMQLELKRIQREVGITFIFVTHDQNEALTMSDRLVVMNAGRIEQLGAPREVYERPRTRFVAGFIGTSNLITGTVARLDGTTATLETSADESIVVSGRRRRRRRASASRWTSPSVPRRSCSRPSDPTLGPVRDPRPGQRGRLPRHVHAVRGHDRRRQRAAGVRAERRRLARTSPTAIRTCGCRGARSIRCRSRGASPRPTTLSTRRPCDGRRHIERLRRDPIDVLRGLTQPQAAAPAIPPVRRAGRARPRRSPACSIPGSKAAAAASAGRRGATQIAKFWANAEADRSARTSTTGRSTSTSAKDRRPPVARPVHQADRHQGQLQGGHPARSTPSSARSQPVLASGRAPATT